MWRCRPSTDGPFVPSAYPDISSETSGLPSMVHLHPFLDIPMESSLATIEIVGPSSARRRSRRWHGIGADGCHAASVPRYITGTPAGPRASPLLEPVIVGLRRPHDRRPLHLLRANAAPKHQTKSGQRLVFWCSMIVLLVAGSQCQQNSCLSEVRTIVTGGNRRTSMRETVAAWHTVQKQSFIKDP